VLADLFGGETDAWVGRRVQLFAADTFYQGKPVKGDKRADNYLAAVKLLAARIWIKAYESTV
jgi:hypothetical protein